MFKCAHLSARPALRQRGFSTMAAAARTIYVKGDPKAQVLGDCPFSHRAMLTLELKGLEYDKEYIDFSNKPDWLYKHTEKGTVPILNDDGKWVPDSGDICTYLDETYPPSLGKAQVEGVAESLLPSFLGFLKASDDEVSEKESALLEQLQQLESYLKDNGPYLNGEKMGAFDALVAPRVYHISEALPHFRDWSLPDSLPEVKNYLAKVKGSQAFKNTYYSPDIIISGWQSHMQS